MSPRRAVALAGAAILLGAGGLAATTTGAQAASTQRICSSKYSDPFSVYVNGRSVDRSTCVTVPKGTQVKLEGATHKVGYDKKPYSSCRESPSGYFTPYQGADIIYFQTYPLENCRGIGIAGRVVPVPATG